MSVDTDSALMNFDADELMASLYASSLSSPTDNSPRTEDNSPRSDDSKEYNPKKLER